MQLHTLPGQFFTSDRPMTDTELKQHLTRIMLSGRLTLSEHDWLLHQRLHHSALSADNQILIRYIFDDIRSGLIAVEQPYPPSPHFL